MVKYIISWHVEDIFDNLCYYRLERIKDKAILSTSEDIRDLLIYCWDVGIARKDVVIL